MGDWVIGIMYISKFGSIKHLKNYNLFLEIRLEL